jgi:tetratricopeptide (TPR) repeat protein
MTGRRFDLRVRMEQLLSKERRALMNTRSNLKTVTFLINLVLTFMIAGLYVSVKVEALDDTGNELQATRHAIHPISIFEEEQHLAQKNMAKLEVIMEPVPDNSQKFSKTETATQTKLLNKQAQESGSSIGIPASSGTHAKEITEKQDEAEEKNISSQKEKIMINAQAADAYISRGVSNLKKGRIEDAISDFNRAIVLEPNNAVAYNARASAYFMHDQIDKAIVDYTKSIEMNPEDADIYNLRGNTYYKNGKIDKAIADYTRAIKINPRLATAYYNRGSAYIFEGKIEKASHDYKKALKLNPRYGETNDEREIECRRLEPMVGSILRQKRCATKSWWDAGVIVHEKMPGVTTYTKEFASDSLLIDEGE